MNSLSTVDTTASKQWMHRSNDERYLSMQDLYKAVCQRKAESWTASPSMRDLRIVPNPSDEGIGVQVYDPTAGETRILEPTNWGFNQLAQYAGAPSAYMRKLPAQLAAINLQYGLERFPLRDQGLILGQSNGDHKLRAITSTSYGRIWDKQVCEAVMRVNTDGRWVIPAASYATTNPKRATTLYASDRDVFIFLVDPSHPIEVNGETLFRGFYTWNSETGNATFGLTTFLYRYVCDNRMIWGQTNVRELNIRHTGGAPERFAYEGSRYLVQYSEESTGLIVEGIKKAQAYEIPKAAEKNGVEDWLTSRGFTSAIAKSAVAAAQAEEGQARSLWDIVNGVTAYARQIPHTDERIAVEKQGSKLMELVSGK